MINDLHWKTGRQAASLISTKTKKTKTGLNRIETEEMEHVLLCKNENKSRNKRLWGD